MAFAGMMGRVLAQTMLRQKMSRDVAANAARGAGYRGSFRSSGKFLFVAHPNCCPKCTQINGTLWNTSDVAYISHPNCKCATIEAPDGLSPAELIDWTKHPVGTMRFGFNYGVSLRPVQLTNENRDKAFAMWKERMDPESAKAHPRRRVRALVSQEQIDAIRAKAKSGELPQGKNLTGRVQGMIKAAESRRKKRTEAGKLAEKMLGGVGKTRIVESQKRRIPVRQPENKQRSGPLELPKLREGTVWNPNSRNRVVAPKLQEKNSSNARAMRKDSYSNAKASTVRIPSTANNVQFSAALMGAARMLNGSRAKAMNAFKERQKKKKREEKERIERLRRIGLL